MLEAIAIDVVLVALVPVLLVAALVVRRLLLVRAAAFEMALRVRRGDAARGWSFGVARYDGDRVQWYRTFSAWPAPSRRLVREQLHVLGSREPTPAERAAIPRGHLVVECLDGDRELDMSMTGSALTGLLAWLEAAPPGRGVAA